MQIGEFDVLEETAAQRLLLACAEVPRWADALVAGRPYGARDALLDAAARLATTWTGDEVEQALADHPRIGESHRGDGESAASSRAEQAGVDRTDDDVAARLLAGNRAYEERFGRIFLVRAAGRDAEQVLALLEQRLSHDEDTELRVTAGQLAEIALLRLREKVAA